MSTVASREGHTVDIQLGPDDDTAAVPTGPDVELHITGPGGHLVLTFSRRDAGLLAAYITNRTMPPYT